MGHVGSLCKPGSTASQLSGISCKDLLSSPVISTKISIRPKILNLLSKLYVFDGLIFERDSRVSATNVF